MNRLEPNLLLAVTTGIALLLLLTTTIAYGPENSLLRNPLMAIICAGAFILLNPWMSRKMNIPPRPPMIHPDSPSTALWSAVFPTLIILSAAIPVIFQGPDYGLLVIFGSIWFGLTAESALKARQLR